MTPMPDKKFDTFKYAEEHADDLHQAGRLFRITNAFGVRNEDDYLTDEFLVEDLGPAPKGSVGQNGIYVGDDDG